MQQKLSTIIILLTNINNKLKNIENHLEDVFPKLPVDDTTHYVPTIFNETPKGE